MRNPPDHLHVPTAKRRRYDNAPSVHNSSTLPGGVAPPSTQPHHFFPNSNNPPSYPNPNSFNFPAPQQPPLFRESSHLQNSFDPRANHDAPRGRSPRLPPSSSNHSVAPNNTRHTSHSSAANGSRMSNPDASFSTLLDAAAQLPYAATGRGGGGPAASTVGGNTASRLPLLGSSFTPPLASSAAPNQTTLPPLSLHPPSAIQPPAMSFQPSPGFGYPSLPPPMHPATHHTYRRSEDRNTVPSSMRNMSRGPPQTPQTNLNTSSSSDGSLAIRNLSQVREALALLRDGSPIINALYQTITQRGDLSPRLHVMRERILNFKGFRAHDQAKLQWLMPLSKTDLEILAWIFVVSKHGKKEDVAKRIIASLRCPLAYRVPVVGRRPHIPSRSGSRNPHFTRSGAAAANSGGGGAGGGSGGGGASSGGGGGGTAANTNGPTPPITRARANMPTVPSVGTDRTVHNRRMLNLTQMLDREPSVVPDLVALSTTNGPPQPRQNLSRTKQLELTCYGLLQGYNFMDGENAFNEPLNEPLGLEKYVFFSSAQLSRGTEDPVLKFPTPAPIRPEDRAEVTGGDVQIHLRCLRVDVDKPRAEWKQSWPFPASCRVNGNAVTLNQAQRYTNGKLAGRDAATNITAYLRKFTSNGIRPTNKVALRRQTSSATAAWGQFVLFAQEIIVHSHATMMQNVQKRSENYWHAHRKDLETKGDLAENATVFDMARLGVMQFMNDPDGVTVASMKVSLRCPLALTRIEIPVKGKHCQHVQCFDLGTFLEYARRSSKFECPVCNKATAHPSALVVSPYIEIALVRYRDCDEIEILKSGDMEAVERKQTGVASDDEGDGDGFENGDSNNHGGVEGGNRNNQNNNNSSNSRSQANPSSKVTEVVDLTLDSDDEDAGDGGDEDAVMSGAVGHQDAYLQDHEGDGGDGGGDEGDGLDQDDIDFTFNADFCAWNPVSHHHQNNIAAPATRSNTRSNMQWPCDDVIAIDSD